MNKTSLIFFTAASVFIGSLFFPAFLAEAQNIDGYWVLFLGWMGFLFFQFAWYAAPLMILAIYTSVQSPRFAFLLAVLAIVIASEAFLFDEIPLREAKQNILGYGVGFYLWYGSFYIAALGVLQKLISWRTLGKSQRQIEEQYCSRQTAGSFDFAQPRTGVAKKIILSSSKRQKIESQSSTIATPPPLPVKKSVLGAVPPPLPILRHANSYIAPAHDRVFNRKW